MRKLFRRKKPKVGYRPAYIDYNGNAHQLNEMSIRHLRNAVKGFRRKGYVPTWEYEKGKNRPMGILDFLILELEEREKNGSPGRNLNSQGVKHGVELCK